MSKQSKYLSLILRHHPDLVGLTLKPGGWVRIDELLRGMKRAGRRMTIEELHQVVEDNNKKRFTISECGKLIRAAQGHSVDVDLGYEEKTPPETLFHGTARANLDSIFENGLRPGKRHQVHLSVDQETAINVGQRHGKPVVLRVNTAAMHEDGHKFFISDNGVWLTDLVPAKYLGF